jgi:CBS domain-containing protein
MAYIKNVLQKKTPEVWSISPEATIQDALARMAEKHIGALVVLDSGVIVGIFSERDYARKVAESKCICLDVPVREMMSHPVFFANPEQTVDECMTLMTAKRIRHLPVIQNDQLIGMISIGDLVKSMIAEKETTIKSLEHYIMGSQIRS